ncbi:hypothetical protein [Helicobacter trogontum]|uniref:DUF1574 domain-containing protein n=1 Tax=Helicobacter trogontum TaxID=50960 RepID=A0A4U8SAF0_9HELI|nr:hypothetical protein [Helicobacter trogontum]TLD82975.1 hypothetical protein LS81_006425 [Helicobacter trogontum]
MQYKRAVIIMIVLQPIYLVCIYCLVFFGQIFYMYIEYPQYIHQKQKTKQTQNADIVIIGNSRAKSGFIPNEIKKMSSINLGVGGSSPIIGFYTLKRYLKNSRPPKVVVLSYSADYLISPADFFWQGGVKTGFLEFNEIFSVLEKARELKDCVPFENAGGGCNKMDVYKYFLDLRNFGKELVTINITLKRYRMNKHIFKELDESNGHFYYGRSKAANGNFSEVDIKDFSVSPLVNYYLHEIAALARQHGVIVAMYVMPINIHSFQQLNPTFLQNYNKFYDTLEERYGIISLNKLYAMPSEAFGDHSHLYAGAKEVTWDIYNKLLAKNLLE